MLAVVYLMEVKKNIIIPQQWIFGFDQEILNNTGKASYQNRRIFWSNRGVSADGIPDGTIKPNFHLAISKIFPPGNAACYIARVRRYCGKYMAKLYTK